MSSFGAPASASLAPLSGGAGGLKTESAGAAPSAMPSSASAAAGGGMSVQDSGTEGAAGSSMSSSGAASKTLSKPKPAPSSGDNQTGAAAPTGAAASQAAPPSDASSTPSPPPQPGRGAGATLGASRVVVLKGDKAGGAKVPEFELTSEESPFKGSSIASATGVASASRGVAASVGGLALNAQAEREEKDMRRAADRQVSRLRSAAEREWENLRRQGNLEDQRATKEWVMQIMKVNEHEAEKMMQEMDSQTIESIATEAKTQTQFREYVGDEREFSRMKGQDNHVGREAEDVDDVLKSGIFEKPYGVRHEMMKGLEGADDHTKLDKMGAAINIGIQAGAPAQDKYVLDQFDRMNPKKSRQQSSDLSTEEQAYLDQLNSGGHVNMNAQDAVDGFRTQFNVDDEIAKKKVNSWRSHVDSMSGGDSGEKDKKED